METRFFIDHIVRHAKKASKKCFRKHVDNIPRWKNPFSIEMNSIPNADWNYMQILFDAVRGISFFPSSNRKESYFYLHAYLHLRNHQRI